MRGSGRGGTCSVATQLTRTIPSSLAASSKQIEQIISQNQGALNGGAQSIAEIGPAIAELRTTLASVRAISRKLENNPGAYLLGKDKIQEFQP